MGCSPWGHEESDTTERLPFSLFTFMHWRRKWNPLQCSCLGNPRDAGAWWAALYGVAESDTTEATEQQQQHVYLLFLLGNEFRNLVVISIIFNFPLIISVLFVPAVLSGCLLN